MKKEKVCLFVHDLAMNPIVRAYPLALALQKAGYDIEVFGMLISGEEIYAPYREALPYTTVSISGRIDETWRACKALAAKAKDGDIMYGFKPRNTSFLPALIASGWGKKKPLLLDVEDDELFAKITGFQNFYRGLLSHHSPLYIKAVHQFLSRAGGVSVVSSRLQTRYRGQRVLHGPDEQMFQPGRTAALEARKKFQLPENGNLILFAGKSLPYKGLAVISEALQTPGLEPFSLVLAGNPDSADFRACKQNLQERCHLLGLIPYQDMPALLDAVDIVPTVQLRTDYTEAQIPAKLLEAMAMKKILIGSKVSDIADILGEGERGYVVEPGNTDQVVDALRHILKNPTEAQKKAIAGYEFFLANASVAANAGKLHLLIEQAKTRLR